jgi:hypothetical protein
MPTGTEAELEKVIAFLEDPERRKVWAANSPQMGDVISVLSKAKNDLLSKQEKAALKATFEAVRVSLANPSAMSVEDIKLARQKLVLEVEPKTSLMDQQFAADVAQVKQSADRAYVAKLHETARSAANQATDLDGRRAALEKYRIAEDETVKLFDESYKKNKELETYYGDHYREVINESDVLAKAIFTPDYIEKQPWKDLLSNDQAPNWNASSLEGFTYRFERGALFLRGPNAAAKSSGAISIADREQLRDFVLDIEFTITKGEFEMYLRVGKRFDGTVETMKLSALEEPSNPTFILMPGESYSGTITYIGSSWVCELSAGDPAGNEAVKWSQSRKGGIGFLIPPESEFKITRMRVRSLRQSGSN